MANDNEVKATLLEQRLYAKADKSTQRVVDKLLEPLWEAVRNEGRYCKVRLGVHLVGYMRETGGVKVTPQGEERETMFNPLDAGEILDALRQTLFNAWRDKFRAEAIDAFIARVENSK
jgi:hypothetical protein